MVGWNFARGLAGRGHRVAIVSRPEGDVPTSAREEGLDFIPLPLKHEFDFGSARRLAKVFDPRQPVGPVLDADAPPDVRQTGRELQPGLEHVSQVGRPLGQHLVGVPVSSFHHAADRRDVLLRRDPGRGRVEAGLQPWIDAAQPQSDGAGPSSPSVTSTLRRPL